MGRLAAADPGERRVGLALSDELKMIARPLPCVDASGLAATAKRIIDVLSEFEIEVLFMGRPRHMHGDQADGAQRAEALAEELRKLGVSVRMVDERLSTVEASRKLFEAGVSSRDQRSKIDSASAVVMLQAQLDSCGMSFE